MAAELATVNELLESGVDPNSPREWLADWTPLHYVAQLGHTEIIDALLDHGAEPKPRVRHGQTPLMQTGYWGRTEAKELLLRRGGGEESEVPPKMIMEEEFASAGGGPHGGRYWQAVAGQDCAGGRGGGGQGGGGGGAAGVGGIRRRRRRSGGDWGGARLRHSHVTTSEPQERREIQQPPVGLNQ
eukprot:COSAG04_NODE_56_length_30604_cov_692.571119_37_plen_185_part_00